MSDPEALPRYGDPNSPVIVQLVRAILLAGLRARALEMRLEWRDRPATFQALLDLGEPPAHPQLIHSVDEEDAPPTGGWAVVHVFPLGKQQVTLVPPSKLWWVVKHRLLSLAGVNDDPAAGYRTDEYDGAMRQELVSSNGEEIIGLRFERVPGGEHVVLNWG
jgi:hypothetical protein